MSVIKNTSVVFLFKVIQIVVSIVVTPYLLTGLGFEKYGILMILILAIGWADVITVPLSQVVVRKVAETEFSVRVLVDGIVWLKLLLAAATILIISFFAGNWIYFKGVDGGGGLVSLSFSILVVVKIVEVFVSSICIGKEEHLLVSSVSFISVLLKYSVGLLVINSVSDGLIWYLVVYVLVSMLSIVYLLRRLYVEGLDDIEGGYETNYIDEVDRASLKRLFVASLASVIVNQVDKLILVNFIGYEQYGEYGLIMQVVTQLPMIGAVVSQVLLPRFSVVNRDYGSKHVDIKVNQYVLLMAITMFVLACGLIVFRVELFSFWLGERWVLNGEMELVFSLLVIAYSINAVKYVHVQHQIAVKREDIQMIILLLSMAPYLICVWISVLEYGRAGAAASFLFYQIITYAALVYMKRIYLIRSISDER